MNTSTNAQQVILGTGPLGQAVARALIQRGAAVRMVNRSGRADVPAGVEVVGTDLYDPAKVHEVTRDAAVVYQCAQPAYQDWQEKFPPLQTSIVEGVARSGAVLVVGDNLYMYGDTHGAPIHEGLPYMAHTRKGRTRAAMAEALLNAHQSGKLRVAIGRGADFYGPQVLGSTAGERAFTALLQGKPIEVYGDPDAPHTLTFISDFGEALAVLGENESAWGQAWHVPNAKTLTQREFFTLACELAGREPKFTVMGKMMMRLGGLFVPEAREMVEMMYEFEKPFIVDDRKYKAAFGDHSTPIREGLRQTLDWYAGHLEKEAAASHV